MIAKTKTKNILNTLNRLYYKDNINKEYYSKLALLELCGWLEESIDDIAIKYGKRKRLSIYYENLLNENIVNPIYGFKYEIHFAQLFLKVFGIYKFMKLEKKINTFELNQFKSDLSFLKRLRDSYAHTTIPGCTRTFHVPSYFYIHLDRIYLVLKKFEKNVKTIIG